MSEFFLGDLPTHLPNSKNIDKIDDTGYNDKIENVDTRDKMDSQIQETINDDTNDDTNDMKNDDKEAICIPGTNITLQTEEDIAKWIEERKKKWPTRKNMELKKKEAEKRSSEHLDDIDKSKTGNERDVKKQRNVCRFYQQYRRCKFGNKCKNAHINDNSPSAQALNCNSNTKLINNIEVIIPQRYKNTPKNTSLFSKLVKKDQSEHENELILDFLLYLNDKKLIDHNLSI